MGIFEKLLKFNKGKKKNSLAWWSIIRKNSKQACTRGGASLIQLPEDTSYLKHKLQPRLSLIKMRAAGGKPPRVQGIICTVLIGSEGKESACNAGDPGSILALGRSPGKGHGNPFQYSCLEKSHGQRNLVGYTQPMGPQKSRTWLNDRAHTHTASKWWGQISVWF